MTIVRGALGAVLGFVITYLLFWFIAGDFYAPITTLVGRAFFTLFVLPIASAMAIGFAWRG